MKDQDKPPEPTKALPRYDFGLPILSDVIVGYSDTGMKASFIDGQQYAGKGLHGEIRYRFHREYARELAISDDWWSAIAINLWKIIRVVDTIIGEAESFSTVDIVNLFSKTQFDIKRERLKDWITNGYVIPKKEAKGRGIAAEFTRIDLYAFATFHYCVTTLNMKRDHAAQLVTFFRDESYKKMEEDELYWKKQRNHEGRNS